ncbi:MAG: RNA pyrophosphohydrolase [Hyphomicrobiaceae bacterium]|nr:MAG: RNA pyrophosphohydrolase [Hyphomicrobiaceae bacterium]
MQSGNADDPDRAASRGYRACVGVLLLNKAGQVWIGRRHDAPGEPEGPGSWWQMPQGGIDEDEEPARAALRELYEETGIRSVEIIAESPGWYTYDLPAELARRAWGGKYRGQKQKWFALRFLGSDDEVAIVRPPGHQSEFVDWRWAAIDELTDLIVPFKRAVYEQVVRDFAPLAVPKS